MTEYNVYTVMTLMENRGITPSNYASFINLCIDEFSSSSISDEEYFLRIASILSCSQAKMDVSDLEVIFSPWREGYHLLELELMGDHYSFWLLLEQLGHRLGFNNAAAIWLDDRIGNAVSYSQSNADSQLVLILKLGFLGQAVTNRIAMWVIYNASLGINCARPIHSELEMAAKDRLSKELGGRGFHYDIIKSKTKQNTRK